jgi:hypothetical protein
MGDDDVTIMDEVVNIDSKGNINEVVDIDSKGSNSSKVQI